MTDRADLNRRLAASIIDRLNDLIKSSMEARDAIEELIDQEISVPEEVADHPGLQVSDYSDRVPEDPYALSVLGLLNGVCGVIPDGPHKDRGYITAIYDDEGTLLNFVSTLTIETSTDGIKENREENNQ